MAGQNLVVGVLGVSIKAVTPLDADEIRVNEENRRVLLESPGHRLAWIESTQINSWDNMTCYNTSQLGNQEDGQH